MATDARIRGARDLIASLTPIRYLGHGSRGVVFLCQGPDGAPTCYKVYHNPACCSTWLAECQRRSELAARVIQAPFPTLASERGITESKYPAVLSYPCAVPRAVRMELCGPSLASALIRGGAFPEDEIMWILDQAAWALGLLHESGLAHADVKPGNVLYAGPARGGFARVKLADYDEVTPVPATEVVMTETYRAPEIDGVGEWGTPVDAWGLGCLAYSLATAEVPRGALDPEEAVMRVGSERPALGNLLGRLLVRDPHSRATMREIRKMTGTYLH
jgi:serine/threonine protein kinase